MLTKIITVMKDSLKNLIRIYNLRDDSVVHLHSQDRCKSCKLPDIEDLGPLLRA